LIYSVLLLEEIFEFDFLDDFFLEACY